jgi:hypothetical protein
MSDVVAERRALVARLFPAGVPRLWCPPVTHVSAARTPDAERIRTHLRGLAPHVGGLLIPGPPGKAGK